jgi:serine/threonine-protein kinase
MRDADPSSEDVSRFVREARIQGRLQHPAIVPVHDLALDSNGHPFFVMKALQGETLASVLSNKRTGRPRSRAELLRAFIDVCLAIELAHTSSVLHRDLKPGNIALGDFGEVYVLDWGIARILGHDPDTLDDVPPEHAKLGSDAHPVRASLQTMPGAVLGTPGYMAPEQLRGEPDVGPATDIYALGCILFEILAGEPLHARSTALQTTAQGVDARPSLRAPGREVPPELDAICVRATALHANERFATARALANEVQRYLDGDRDVARRRELARTALLEARQSLERSSDQDRRDAMRAAGRALALDPESTEAAELVSHLVLAAPSKIPDELEAELVDKTLADVRNHARFAAAALFAYAAFLPMLMWIGVRDWPYAGLCYGTLAVTIGFNYWTSRLAHPPRYCAWGSFLLCGVLVVLFGRFAPLVVPAGVATITMAVAANHPYVASRGKAVILLFVASGLAGWGLELVGVFQRTEGVRSLVSHLLKRGDGLAEPLAVAFYMAGVVAVIGMLSLRLARTNREIRTQLELQAWHLRQLVPAARSSASSARVG